MTLDKCPRLTVMLLTYDRLEYATRTLYSMIAHLSYPEPYRVHIADDGSSQEYRDALVRVLAQSRAASPLSPVGGVTVTNAERLGYGRSYNLATQAIHPTTDVVLVLEDDWELERELDALRLMQIFNADEDIGCIRLGYIGYTQELRGRFVAAENGNGDKYLELDADSPERHVFSGHPRFETVAWQRRVGPWTEGLDPGATEFDVAGKPEARQGVVWPLDYIKTRGDLFTHFGTIQARTDQREAVT